MEQLDIFNLGVEYHYRPPLLFNRPVRLFEAFAGVGCQAMAFKRAGLPYVSVGISEIDKHAIKSYEAIHGKTTNYGDIKLMGEIPPCDVFTWSFPCFTADTLVLTNNGNIPIVDIKVGMEVLTHNNRYKKVKTVFDNGGKSIYKIIGMGIDEIKTTRNHKFYVREKYNAWNNQRRSYDRLFYDPKWLETTQLTKNHYLGIAINQNSILPYYIGTSKKYIDGRVYKSNRLMFDMQKTDFWWVIGRYIGDGWQRYQNGIIICDDVKSYNEITDVLDRLEWNYNVVIEKSVAKIHIPFEELKEYVKQFGTGASKKHLTSDVLDLPINYLKSFLEGYFSADGSFDGNLQRASSVSKQLIYDIAQCVAKVYKTPYRIYRQVRKKRAIEGRNINQKPIYTISFKYQSNIQDKAFYENNYIWFPINKIEIIGEENVYDIEVEDDHSFMANNVIAHNCTDLSKAGKRKGMTEETRSGLVYEVLRLLKATRQKPECLIMENVPDLIQEAFKAQFYEIQKEIESPGYKNFTLTLNAIDYGVAQNRDRVFMVSLLGDYHYEFPMPIALEKRLKDYLEPNVAEKYYLSEKMIRYFNDNSKANEEKGNGFRFTPKRTDDIANALALKSDRMGGNFVVDPICLNSKVNGKQPSLQDRIYSVGGTSTAITQAFMPSIAIPEATEGVVTQELRIRKLTPRECWRLMGIDDADFDKAKASGVSNSQLYKQAGNGIVVDVFAAILKNLISQ